MMSSSMPSSVVHFRFGDALRAVAIALVVLSHIVMVVPFLAPLLPYQGAMGNWGVDAFFVLSGFLLGRPYIDALLGRRPLPKWRRYAKRRFFRIWPAYAVVVLIAFAKSVLHHGANTTVVTDTVVHLLMIHNFFPQFVQGADNISLWTMAVDAQFYVLLPLIAFCLSKRHMSERRRDILALLGAIIGASLVWRIVIAGLSLQGEEIVLSVQRNVIGMGFSFAVGMLVAYSNARALSLSPRLARSLFAIAIAILVSDFAASALINGENAYRELVLDVLGTVSVGLTVFAIPYVGSKSLDAALGSTLLSGFAANAYGLYLLHVPIKQTVDTYLTAHGFAAHTARYGIFFLIAFCICCAFSVPLLHRYIERPLLTLKERAREELVMSAT